MSISNDLLYLNLRDGKFDEIQGFSRFLGNKNETMTLHESFAPSLITQIPSIMYNYNFEQICKNFQWKFYFSNGMRALVAIFEQQATVFIYITVNVHLW